MPAWDKATGLRLRAHQRLALPSLVARPRWWLLALVVVLHVLFLLVARQALLTTVPPQLPASPALQARFVPILLLPPPAPPPPVTLPARRPAPHRPTVVARTHPDVRGAANAAPSSALLLRDRDGQVLLPAHSASSAATPDYVQRSPQGDTRIMHNVDPVPYKATRFEKYFPPADETAGGALVRHVGEALLKTKDVDLPRGVHLKCKTLLGIPTFDCRMPPAPPSAKSGDARLSMAPAKPLAVDPHAPPPPSVAACIALYRAGKPLVWGCPADTPNRAVDDELHQRAAGANPGA
jgi:hypothetical protein